MKLPAMRYSDGIRKHKQVKFGGLDHRVGAEDGALYDMRNLYSDDYPILAVRPKRPVLEKLEKPNGLFYHHGLMWVDGTDVYYDGALVGQVEDSKKTFGALGPYIVILPDKMCYHTEDGSWKAMESSWESDSNTMTLRILSADGRFDDNDAYVNSNTYTALAVGMNTLVTSQDAENTAPDFSQIFRVGDAVTIQGLKKKGAAESAPMSAIIRGFRREVAAFTTAGSYRCCSRIIFDTGIFTGYGIVGTLTITREVPQLRYLCEDGNRLWGCDGDTIYASKLGDPLSWNVFDGLETDSWALTPGSSGEFTGCINFQGYPTFFKEDRLYKVYGSLPSNFSVVDSPCLGVAAGCADTLALVWGSVFYLGTNGPMVYTGSLPRPVSHELGDIRLTGGSAGSDGLKYYASLSDPGGQSRLYVYDVQRSLWHIEDEMAAVGFCRVDGDVYCLGADGAIQILGTAKTAPEGAAEEEDLPWMVEFADFTHEDPNHKGVSKLQLRLELEEGSQVRILIQFDSDGVWRTVRALEGTGRKRSWYLPIVPRRCDHYRLRLEGTGRAWVHSLVRESYSGSEYSTK